MEANYLGIASSMRPPEGQAGRRFRTAQLEVTPLQDEEGAQCRT